MFGYAGLASSTGSYRCGCFSRIFQIASPLVSGWSETGAELYRSRSLGEGLGQPTSAVVIIPGENLDYLDVTVNGDGSNLRGVFMLTMRRVENLQALDFSSSIEPVDAFGNLPKAEQADADLYLFGRVKATLQAEVSKLSVDEVREVRWEFELQVVPLLAVLSLEILNSDPVYPPELIVNDRPVGSLAIHLPDLADPAYEGVIHPLDPEAHFQYAGWLQSQKAIPGAVLRVGLNKLVLRVNSHAGPMAVRAVEVQLKHHWPQLEYRLAP